MPSDSSAWLASTAMFSSCSDESNASACCSSSSFTPAFGDVGFESSEVLGFCLGSEGFSGTEDDTVRSCKPGAEGAGELGLEARALCDIVIMNADQEDPCCREYDRVVLCCVLKGEGWLDVKDDLA